MAQAIEDAQRLAIQMGVEDVYRDHLVEAERAGGGLALLARLALKSLSDIGHDRVLRPRGAEHPEEAIPSRVAKVYVGPLHHAGLLLGDRRGRLLGVGLAKSVIVLVGRGVLTLEVLVSLHRDADGEGEIATLTSCTETALGERTGQRALPFYLMSPSAEAMGQLCQGGPGETKIRAHGAAKEDLDVGIAEVGPDAPYLAAVISVVEVPMIPFGSVVDSNADLGDPFLARVDHQTGLVQGEQGGSALQLRELALVVVVPEVFVIPRDVLGAHQHGLGARQDERRNGGAACDDEPRSAHPASEDTMPARISQ